MSPKTVLGYPELNIVLGDLASKLRPRRQEGISQVKIGGYSH